MNGLKKKFVWKVYPNIPKNGTRKVFQRKHLLRKVKLKPKTTPSQRRVPRKMENLQLKNHRRKSTMLRMMKRNAIHCKK